MSSTLKGAGTLRWQSPELWTERERPKSHQSDVYAFGITIAEVRYWTRVSSSDVDYASWFQILAGREPFYEYREQSAIMMAVAFRGERPPPYPMFRDGTSYYLAWRSATRRWQKKPDHRPSMEEVALMLKPKEVSSGEAGSSSGKSSQDHGRRLRPRGRSNYAVDTSDNESDNDYSPSDNGSDHDEDVYYDGTGGNGAKKYCFCDGCGSGAIVRCCNIGCEIQWVRLTPSLRIVPCSINQLTFQFHMGCLSPVFVPENGWLCIPCEELKRR